MAAGRVSRPSTVDGLDGRWAAVPYNRTVVSQAASTQGQTYEVVTNVPRPDARADPRARGAAGPTRATRRRRSPADLPPIIGELAAAGHRGRPTTDYDRLIALQRWFRGGEFEYSLEAPVEDGFDGSGAEAVAKFLEVREGYCVHFASAFALMARTLSMPTRIVVGYLPGTATSDVDRARDRLLGLEPPAARVARGATSRASAGSPFEPTAGLGVPTTLLAGRDPCRRRRTTRTAATPARQRIRLAPARIPPTSQDGRRPAARPARRPTR